MQFAASLLTNELKDSIMATQLLTTSVPSNVQVQFAQRALAREPWHDIRDSLSKMAGDLLTGITACEVAVNAIHAAGSDADEVAKGILALQIAIEHLLDIHESLDRSIPLNVPPPDSCTPRESAG